MELTIDQALERGIAAHKEGKLPEAEKLYRSILGAQPKHPDANHNLGVLALGVGRVEEALPFFKLALEANPKQGQFWLSYIDALIKNGELDAARQILQRGKGSGLSGDKVDALAAQLVNVVRPSKEQIDGLVSLYSRGKLEEALVQGKALAEQFPSDATIPNILGAIRAGMGQHEEAIKHYRRAVELKSDYAEAYSNLGASLGDLGRSEEAIIAYNKTIELKPEFAETYNNLGNALNALDRYDEAVGSFNKAIELKSDFAEAYSNLGTALTELEKYEDAISQLNKAIEIKPDYANAYSNLGNVLYAIGRKKEAIFNYKKVIELNPSSDLAYKALGSVFVNLNRHKEANASFNKVLKIKPDDIDLWLSNDNRSYIEFPSVHLKHLKKFVTWNQELGWCPTPGMRKQDRNDTYILEGSETYPYYTIDDDGARIGFPHSNLESPTKFGLFGDSYCMSREVDDSQTIGWHLGELSDSEVKNYGVGGYGLDQAYLRFKTELVDNSNNKRFTDTLFIITPYTIARAVSVYRHYLQPGNIFAVKPRMIVSPEGTLTVIPSPLQRKNDLQSLEKFAGFFRKWDPHFANKAWLIKDKTDYYSDYWTKETRLFFCILRELETFRKKFLLNIKFILVCDKIFLKYYEKLEKPTWTRVFLDAQKCYPNIQFLDIMPELVNRIDIENIWLRGGNGHFSNNANNMVAKILLGQ